MFDARLFDNFNLWQGLEPIEQLFMNVREIGLKSKRDFPGHRLLLYDKTALQELEELTAYYNLC